MLDEALAVPLRRERRGGLERASRRRRSPRSRRTRRASRAPCYLGSVFDIPGATTREKLQHVNEVDDSIRRFLCFEPRGRSQASANLVFPSTDPEADAGFIILQADRAHAMSGSNTICVVTALLETGTIPMSEPETLVTLETAAGLVRARATCRDGRCERVTLDGVPSFVEALDVPLHVPGLRRSSRSTSPTAAATTCSSTRPSSICR